MGEFIIEFDNFSFQYNAQSKPTLHNIDLKISKGEKILIAGPSGCGKSTLAHCINGLIPFSYKGEMGGTLRIDGRLNSDLSLFEISKSVGTVLQDSDAQFVGLTVAEDIAFALENECIPTDELKERVLKTAKMVNVADLLKSSPREISGGQKQRVSVGGVLVDTVDVLLFDEPLANLDPATGKEAIELIDEVAKSTGAAVIIIEHRLEDVLHKYVDRVLLMHQGSIIFDGSSDELLSKSLLTDNGIREPLYVTALKYAGVDITANKKPSNIKDVLITKEDADRVNNWYESVTIKKTKADSEVLLKVENLEYKYKSRSDNTLKGITLSFKKGEMTAIVGTNGAGKSTFAKVICGLEAEDLKGTITYRGSDFTRYSIKERAEEIGYVMQNPNQMISKIQIMDEVALGLRSRNYSEEDIKPRVEKVLKICGLWPFRNWPISALSYGQKKRVTIASILVLDPEIIILDEPTAGQDYAHYTEIMEFLKELNEQGITILMVTHDMHLMLEYADRAIVFSEGRVICDDSCVKVLTNTDIIKRANLKETSLYELAVRCNIEDGTSFVERFIDYERTVARNSVIEENRGSKEEVNG